MALMVTAQPGGCDVLILCMKAFAVFGPQITLSECEGPLSAAIGRTNPVGGYWSHDGGEPDARVLTGPIERRCCVLVCIRLGENDATTH